MARDRIIWDSLSPGPSLFPTLARSDEKLCGHLESWKSTDASTVFPITKLTKVVFLPIASPSPACLVKFISEAVLGLSVHLLATAGCWPSCLAALFPSSDGKMNTRSRAASMLATVVIIGLWW